MVAMGGAMNRKLQRSDIMVERDLFGIEGKSRRDDILVKSYFHENFTPMPSTRMSENDRVL